MVLTKFSVVIALLAGCDSILGLETEIGPDAGSEHSTAACPAEYTTQIGTKWYRFVAPKMRYWLDADLDCRDDSSPSITHLPVLDDQTELALLHAAVPEPVPWIIYVGYARDVHVDPPAFRAVTGAPLLADSTMWTTDDPDGGADTVVKMSDNSELFDDLPGSGPSLYFCQCDGVAATEVFNLQ
jgi:hypothetical protein